MSFWLQWQALLLLLVSGAVVAQKPNCVSSPNMGLSSIYDAIPNFQSGTSRLEGSTKAQRYNRYNISLSVHFNNSSYDLAISIQNIYSFQPSQGYDFFVNGIKRVTMIEVVLAIDVTTTWSYAKINYIVSGRPDFAVGQFVADNSAFLQAPPNGSTVTVYHHRSHHINASSDYLYVIPFIRGLRTFDLFTSFTFISAKFNPLNSTLSINLKMNYTKAPIQTLYLSYLIFNMDSDLQITSFNSQSYSPTNINVFSGVSGISPIVNFLSLLTENKNNSTNILKPLLNMGKREQQNFNMIFGINGVIVQTQQSMDLLFRPFAPSTSTSVQVFQCVSKTKCNSLQGTMTYVQKDVFNIVSRCLVCMSNGFYNQTIDACQCVQGYVLSNSSCIKISDSCTANSHYNLDTLSCVCNNLFVNISGQCNSIYSACPAGHIYLQGKCIRIIFANPNTANCSADSLFINKTCVKKKVCSPPLQLNILKNECVCPSNTIFQQNACVSCGQSQTIIGSACQCKAGFFRIQGKCLPCSQNAFYNGNTCVCFRYYTGDGFKCERSSISPVQLARSAPSGIFGGGGIKLN